ncbi:tyrosine-type recombinase/integrase [Bradyrhizobium guangzhouense]|uniref:tyrosine-type recombinase/integrase n=1 Tax=Bradyrhizobium guangzhouense TaxID=1325095 RepID=UPI001009C7D5|nr:tyrosine-type recombinase/integrase [Bradyrhizobium guangzhouense]RXH12467.1 integrase [Bradyrhizobium guangzhouense]
MAKTLTEAPITTRIARARLPAGLHWRGIDPETHLGYRKGKRGGGWLVRWRNGAGYRQAPLGTADDAIGAGTLDYNAAIRAAKRAVEAARAEAKAKADGPLLTVQSVVEAYIEARNARHSRRAGRTVRSDAGHRLPRYVIGQKARGKQKAIPAAPLAGVALHALKESDLLTWRTNLPAELKETTKQRLINDLRAALNAAHAANRKRLDPAFGTVVKHGLSAIKVDDDDQIPIARENQVLTDVQVAHVLRAAQEIDAEHQWEGDLFRLVLLLAATGARFSQVVRMRVGDVQRTQSRLMVPFSRKGKGAKSGAIPIPIGNDVLDALLPAETGRRNAAPLLERWRYKQRPGSIEWHRDGRGPWQTASEIVRPWDAIRRRAGMPELIPYALRHSSIVRGIRANLPIRLVAALHDTSVQMIERHYAKWIVDGLDDLAARAVVPLVPRRW